MWRKMDKRPGGGKKTVTSGEGAGGQGFKSGKTENRRFWSCGGSASGSSSVEAGKRREEEEELERNLQLKVKPVVVLKRLKAEEIEELRREIKKANIQPITSALPFPPEIMEMILDNLKDPTDLQNCSRADPRLSNVLNSRMPVYLFDKVLPHLLEYLTFDDLKSCRLVCQEWKRGVTQLIESQPSSQPYDDQIFLVQMRNPQTRLNFGATPHSRLQPITRIRMDIASMEEFSASYNSLSFAGASPFVGGAVEILMVPLAEGGNLEDEDFVFLRTVNYLVDFFSQFGHHLQHISFKSPRVPSPVQWRIFNCAINCLRHCLNLRTLSMHMSHPPNFHPFMLVLDGIRLPLLHTIEISAAPGTQITHFFINAMVIPYLPQLRKLSLPPSITPIWTPLQNDPLILKELQLDMVASKKDLERLRTIDSPVEKLILKIGFPTVNLTTLLGTLSRFPLRHLELSWTPGVSPVIRERHSTHQALLEIPFVHTVKMTNSVNVDYFFLRGFPNLKHLYLHEKVPRNRVSLNCGPSKAVMKRIASSEAVQIHKFLYGGQMNRSNVWGILPHLKVIVFERVREGDEEEKLKLSWERRTGRGQPINHSLYI